MANDRVSSLDTGYVTGDLSVYPQALDTKDILYEAKNNAETTLYQTLPYSGKYIVVDDASGFPDKGLLRIGPLSTVISLQKGDVFPRRVPGTPGDSEFVYYGLKTGNVFKDLIRGYAKTIQSQWPIGTPVSNSVFAEHHNAIKDTIINIENYLGVENTPASGSLNKILSNLEVKFLAPKPQFRAFPKSGKPSLSVTFQNFSSGDVVRYLWDFGDNTTSFEKSPSHTYSAEGIYTVSLNVITSTGAQGITTKNNYISISNEYTVPFFYVELVDPNLPAYSQGTADELAVDVAIIRFIDQTTGDVAQRIWIFGDGETLTVDDPDVHIAEHIYAIPGDYQASALIIFGDESYKRTFTENIEIL
jgi:PKD repeat protein